MTKTIMNETKNPTSTKHKLKSFFSSLATCSILLIVSVLVFVGCKSSDILGSNTNQTGSTDTGNGTRLDTVSVQFNDKTGEFYWTITPISGSGTTAVYPEYQTWVDGEVETYSITVANDGSTIKDSSGTTVTYARTATVDRSPTFFISPKLGSGASTRNFKVKTKAPSNLTGYKDSAYCSGTSFKVHALTFEAYSLNSLYVNYGYLAYDSQKYYFADPKTRQFSYTNGASTTYYNQPYRLTGYFPEGRDVAVSRYLTKQTNSSTYGSNDYNFQAWTFNRKAEAVAHVDLANVETTYNLFTNQVIDNTGCVPYVLYDSSNESSHLDKETHPFFTRDYSISTAERTLASNSIAVKACDKTSNMTFYANTAKIKNFTLSGIVINGDNTSTNDPTLFAGVKVLVNDAEATTTDASGKFTITGLAANSYITFAKTATGSESPSTFDTTVLAGKTYTMHSANFNSDKQIEVASFDQEDLMVVATAFSELSNLNINVGLSGDNYATSNVRYEVVKGVTSLEKDGYVTTTVLISVIAGSNTMLTGYEIQSSNNETISISKKDPTTSVYSPFVNIAIDSIAGAVSKYKGTIDGTEITITQTVSGDTATFAITGATNITDQGDGIFTFTLLGNDYMFYSNISDSSIEAKVYQTEMQDANDEDIYVAYDVLTQGNNTFYTAPIAILLEDGTTNHVFKANEENNQDGRANLISNFESLKSDGKIVLGKVIREASQNLNGNANLKSFALAVGSSLRNDYYYYVASLSSSQTAFFENYSKESVLGGSFATSNITETSQTVSYNYTKVEHFAFASLIAPAQGSRNSAKTCINVLGKTIPSASGFITYPTMYSNGAVQSYFTFDNEATVAYDAYSGHYNDANFNANNLPSSDWMTKYRANLTNNTYGYVIDQTSNSTAKEGMPGVSFLSGAPYPNPVIALSIRHLACESDLSINLAVDSIFYVEVLGAMAESELTTNVMEFTTYAFKDTETNIYLNKDNYINKQAEMINKIGKDMPIFTVPYASKNSDGTITGLYSTPIPMEDLACFANDSNIYYTGSDVNILTICATETTANKGRIIYSEINAGTNTLNYNMKTGLWELNGYEIKTYGSTDAQKNYASILATTLAGTKTMPLIASNFVVWISSSNSIENVSYLDLHAYDATSLADTGRLRLLSDCDDSSVCIGLDNLDQNDIFNNANDYSEIVIAGLTTAYRVSAANEYSDTQTGFFGSTPLNITMSENSTDPYFHFGESVAFVTEPTYVISSGLDSITYRFKEWKAYQRYNSEVIYYARALTEKLSGTKNAICYFNPQELGEGPGYYILLPIYERVYTVSVATEVQNGNKNQGGTVVATYDRTTGSYVTSAKECETYYNEKLTKDYDFTESNYEYRYIIVNNEIISIILDINGTRNGFLSNYYYIDADGKHYLKTTNTAEDKYEVSDIQIARTSQNGYYYNGSTPAYYSAVPQKVENVNCYFYILNGTNKTFKPTTDISGYNLYQVNTFGALSFRFEIVFDGTIHYYEIAGANNGLDLLAINAVQKVTDQFGTKCILTLEESRYLTNGTKNADFTGNLYAYQYTLGTGYDQILAIKENGSNFDVTYIQRNGVITTAINVSSIENIISNIKKISNDPIAQQIYKDFTFLDASTVAMPVPSTTSTVTTSYDPTDWSFDRHTKVSLTATANAGYRFEGWYEAYYDENSQSFIISNTKATSSNNELYSMISSNNPNKRILLKEGNTLYTYRLTLDNDGDGKIDADENDAHVWTQIKTVATFNASAGDYILSNGKLYRSPSLSNASMITNLTDYDDAYSNYIEYFIDNYKQNTTYNVGDTTYYRNVADNKYYSSRVYNVETGAFVYSGTGETELIGVSNSYKNAKDATDTTIINKEMGQEVFYLAETGLWYYGRSAVSSEVVPTTVFTEKLYVTIDPLDGKDIIFTPNGTRMSVQGTISADGSGFGRYVVNGTTVYRINETDKSITKYYLHRDKNNNLSREVFCYDKTAITGGYDTTGFEANGTYTLKSDYYINNSNEVTQRSNNISYALFVPYVDFILNQVVATDLGDNQTVIKYTGTTSGLITEFTAPTGEMAPNGTIQYLLSSTMLFSGVQTQTIDGTTTTNVGLFRDMILGNQIVRGNTITIGSLNHNYFYVARFVETYQQFNFAEEEEESGVKIQAIFYYNDIDTTNGTDYNLAFRANAQGVPFTKLNTEGDNTNDYAVGSINLSGQDTAQSTPFYFTDTDNIPAIRNMNGYTYYKPDVDDNSYSYLYTALRNSGSYNPSTSSKSVGLYRMASDAKLANKNLYFDINTTVVMVVRLQKGNTLNSASFGLDKVGNLTYLLKPTDEFIAEGTEDYYYYVIEIKYNHSTDNMFLNEIAHPTRLTNLKSDLSAKQVYKNENKYYFNVVDANKDAVGGLTYSRELSIEETKYVAHKQVNEKTLYYFCPCKADIAALNLTYNSTPANDLAVIYRNADNGTIVRSTAGIVRSLLSTTSGTIKLDADGSVNESTGTPYSKIKMVSGYKNNYINLSSIEMFSYNISAVVKDSTTIQNESGTLNAQNTRNDVFTWATGTNFYVAGGREVAGQTLTFVGLDTNTTNTISSSTETLPTVCGTNFPAQYLEDNTFFTATTNSNNYSSGIFETQIAAIDTIAVIPVPTALVSGETATFANDIFTAGGKSYRFAGWYEQKLVEKVYDGDNVTAEIWSELQLVSTSYWSHITLSESNTNIIAMFVEVEEVHFTYNNAEVTVQPSMSTDSCGNAINFSTPDSNNLITMSGWFDIDSNFTVEITPVGGYAVDTLKYKSTVGGEYGDDIKESRKTIDATQWQQTNKSWANNISLKLVGYVLDETTADADIYEKYSGGYYILDTKPVSTFVAKINNFTKMQQAFHNFTIKSDSETYFDTSKIAIIETTNNGVTSYTYSYASGSSTEQSFAVDDTNHCFEFNNVGSTLFIFGYMDYGTNLIITDTETTVMDNAWSVDWKAQFSYKKFEGWYENGVYGTPCTDEDFSSNIYKVTTNSLQNSVYQFEGTCISIYKVGITTTTTATPNMAGTTTDLSDVAKLELGYNSTRFTLLGNVYSAVTADTDTSWQNDKEIINKKLYLGDDEEDGWPNNVDIRANFTGSSIFYISNSSTNQLTLFAKDRTIIHDDKTYNFVGWFIDGKLASESLSFVADSQIFNKDITIEARYCLVHSITLINNDNSQGSILLDGNSANMAIDITNDSTDNAINYLRVNKILGSASTYIESNYAGFYDNKIQLTITASPNPGFALADWNITGLLTNYYEKDIPQNKLTIYLNSDSSQTITISPVFEKTYTLSGIVSSSDTLFKETSEAEQNIVDNSSITLLGAESSMIASNATYGSFVVTNHTAHTYMSVQKRFINGSTIELTATPTAGQMLLGWLVSNSAGTILDLAERNADGTTNSTLTYIISSDTIIRAVFVPCFQINVKVDGGVGSTAEITTFASETITLAVDDTNKFITLRGFNGFVTYIISQSNTNLFNLLAWINDDTTDTFITDESSYTFVVSSARSIIAQNTGAKLVSTKTTTKSTTEGIVGGTAIITTQTNIGGTNYTKNTYFAETETANVLLGSSSSLIAIPSNGYTFVGWYDQDDNLISYDTTANATIFALATKIVAVFAETKASDITICLDKNVSGATLHEELSVSSSSTPANATMLPKSTTTFNYGEVVRSGFTANSQTVTFTANLNENYSIREWVVAGQTVPAEGITINGSSISISSVDGNSKLSITNFNTHISIVLHIIETTKIGYEVIYAPVGETQQKTLTSRTAELTGTINHDYFLNNMLANVIAFKLNNESVAQANLVGKYISGTATQTYMYIDAVVGNKLSIIANTTGQNYYVSRIALVDEVGTESDIFTNSAKLDNPTEVSVNVVTGCTIKIYLDTHATISTNTAESDATRGYVVCEFFDGEDSNDRLIANATPGRGWAFDSYAVLVGDTYYTLYMNDEKITTNNFEFKSSNINNITYNGDNHITVEELKNTIAANVVAIYTESITSNVAGIANHLQIQDITKPSEVITKVGDNALYVLANSSIKLSAPKQLDIENDGIVDYIFIGIRYNGKMLATKSAMTFDDGNYSLSLSDIICSASFEAYYVEAQTLQIDYKTYTINNAGTNPIITTTAGTTPVYGVGETATLTAPARDGLTFIGWFDNTGNQITKLATLSITVRNGNLPIYAHYTTACANVVSSSNTAYGTATYRSSSNNYGEEITMTAIPNTGYVFVGWYYGANICESTKTTFTTNIAHSYVAKFAIARKITLSNNVSNNVQSVIEINVTDALGNETKITTGTYLAYTDQSIRIVAPELATTTFIGWFTQTNRTTIAYADRTTTFTVQESNLSLIATYSSFTIQIETQTNGAVSNVGGAVATTGIFNNDIAIFNTNISLIATPNSGYSFIGFYEDETFLTSNSSISFTATESRNIVAKFAKNISVSVTKIGNGDVSGIPALGYVLYGNPVSLTATPNVGYGFAGWTGTVGGNHYESQNSTISFDGTANVVLTATFAQLVKLDIVSNYNDSTITVDGTEFNNGSYSKYIMDNTSVNLVANTSYTNYIFTKWTIKVGNSVSELFTPTITQTITGDTTITAYYTKTYAVSYTNATISVVPTSGRLAEGTIVTFTPNGIGLFKGWNVNNNKFIPATSSEATNLTIVIKNDIAITAVYAGTKTLTLTSTNGTTNVQAYGSAHDNTETFYNGTTSETFATDTNITLFANPVAGYAFVRYEIDSAIITTRTHSFTLSADTSVNVVYEQIQNIHLVSNIAGVELSYTIPQTDATSYQGQTITLNTPQAQTGYMFMGWYEYDITTGSKTKVTATTPAKTELYYIAYYAKTKAINVTIANYASQSFTENPDGVSYTTQYYDSINEEWNSIDNGYAPVGYTIKLTTTNEDSNKWFNKKNEALNLSAISNINLLATSNLYFKLTGNSITDKTNFLLSNSTHTSSINNALPDILSINTNGIVAAIGVVKENGVTVTQLQPGEKTYTAVANDSYRFVGWFEQFGPNSSKLFLPLATSNTITITPNENGYTVWADGVTSQITATGYFYALVAQFEKVETISISATNGSVTANSKSYNGANPEYAAGEEVVLTANPNAGYYFTGWSTGETTRTISRTMPNAAMSITANFAKLHTTTVTSNVVGGPTGTYTQNEQLAVTATVINGYTFTGWFVNGTEVATTTIYTFTPANDITLVAKYTKQWDITLGANITGTQGKVNDNTVVTFTANAIEGKQFVGFTINGKFVPSTSATSSIAITVNSDISIEAHYIDKVTINYEVSTSTNEAGVVGGTVAHFGETINAEPTLTYLAGDTVILTAIEKSGYTFVGWFENHSLVSSSKTYSFSATANRTLDARFAKAVNVSLVSNLAIDSYRITNASGAATYGYNSTIKLTVTPKNDASYSVISWSSNPSITTISNATTFEITFTITADTVISLNLSKQIELTTAKSGNGSYTVNGEQANFASGNRKAIAQDTEVVVIATPTAGYVFTCWKIGGEVVCENPTFSFNMTANMTIEAVFEQECSLIIPNDTSTHAIPYNIELITGKIISIIAPQNTNYTVIKATYGSQILLTPKEASVGVVYESSLIQFNQQTRTLSVTKNVPITINIVYQSETGKTFKSETILRTESNGRLAVLPTSLATANGIRYTFNGFFTLGGTSLGTASSINKNSLSITNYCTTIIAKYTREYAITIHMQIDGSTTTTTEYKIEGTALELTADTIADTRFIGWYDENNTYLGNASSYTINTDCTKTIYKKYATTLTATITVTSALQEDFNTLAGTQIIAISHEIDNNDRTTPITPTATSFDENGNQIIYANFDIGSALTFVAMPCKSFEFVGWFNGETLLSSNTRYTTSSINDDFSVIAKYAPLAEITIEHKANTTSGTILGNEANYADESVILNSQNSNVTVAIMRTIGGSMLQSVYAGNAQILKLGASGSYELIANNMITDVTINQTAGTTISITFAYRFALNLTAVYKVANANNSFAFYTNNISHNNLTGQTVNAGTIEMQDTNGNIVNVVYQFDVYTITAAATRTVGGKLQKFIRWEKLINTTEPTNAESYVLESYSRTIVKSANGIQNFVAIYENSYIVSTDDESLIYGAKDYIAQSNVTITARPTSTQVLTGWRIDGITITESTTMAETMFTINGDILSFTIVKDHTINPLFANCYNADIIISTYDGATITSSPISGNIEVISTTGKVAYATTTEGYKVVSITKVPAGRSTTITATINSPRYKFVGWYVGDTRLSTALTINITTGGQYEARFVLAYKISATVSGNGSVEIAQGATTITTDSYNTKASYTFTANPGDNYIVTGWIVNGNYIANGDGNRITVEVVSDTNVVACTSKLLTFTTPTISATNGFSASTIDDHGINSPTISSTYATHISNKYAKGSTVSIVASMHDDYNFLGWYVGDTLITTSSIYSFIADETTGSAFNKTYTAKYIKRTKIITINLTSEMMDSAELEFYADSTPIGESGIAHSIAYTESSYILTLPASITNIITYKIKLNTNAVSGWKLTNEGTQISVQVTPSDINPASVESAESGVLEAKDATPLTTDLTLSPKVTQLFFIQYTANIPNPPASYTHTVSLNSTESSNNAQFADQVKSAWLDTGSIAILTINDTSTENLPHGFAMLSLGANTLEDVFSAWALGGTRPTGEAWRLPGTGLVAINNNEFNSTKTATYSLTVNQSAIFVADYFAYNYDISGQNTLYAMIGNTKTIGEGISHQSYGTNNNMSGTNVSGKVVNELISEDGTSIWYGYYDTDTIETLSGFTQTLTNLSYTTGWTINGIRIPENATVGNYSKDGKTVTITNITHDAITGKYTIDGYCKTGTSDYTTNIGLHSQNYVHPTQISYTTSKRATADASGNNYNFELTEIDTAFIETTIPTTGVRHGDTIQLSAPRVDNMIFVGFGIMNPEMQISYSNAVIDNKFVTSGTTDNELTVGSTTYYYMQTNGDALVQYSLTGVRLLNYTISGNSYKTNITIYSNCEFVAIYQRKLATITTQKYQAIETDMTGKAMVNGTPVTVTSTTNTFDNVIHITDNSDGSFTLYTTIPTNNGTIKGSFVYEIGKTATINSKVFYMGEFMGYEFNTARHTGTSYTLSNNPTKTTVDGAITRIELITADALISPMTTTGTTATTTTSNQKLQFTMLGNEIITAYFTTTRYKVTIKFAEIELQNGVNNFLDAIENNAPAPIMSNKLESITKISDLDLYLREYTYDNDSGTYSNIDLKTIGGRDIIYYESADGEVESIVDDHGGKITITKDNNKYSLSIEFYVTADAGLGFPCFRIIYQNPTNYTGEIIESISKSHIYGPSSVDTSSTIAHNFISSRLGTTETIYDELDGSLFYDTTSYKTADETLEYNCNINCEDASKLASLVTDITLYAPYAKKPTYVETNEAYQTIVFKSAGKYLQYGSKDASAAYAALMNAPYAYVTTGAMYRAIIASHKYEGEGFRSYGYSFDYANPDIHGIWLIDNAGNKFVQLTRANATTKLPGFTWGASTITLNKSILNNEDGNNGNDIVVANTTESEHLARLYANGGSTYTFNICYYGSIAMCNSNTEALSMRGDQITIDFELYTNSQYTQNNSANRSYSMPVYTTYNDFVFCRAFGDINTVNQKNKYGSLLGTLLSAEKGYSYMVPRTLSFSGVTNRHTPTLNSGSSVKLTLSGSSATTTTQMPTSYWDALYNCYQSISVSIGSTSNYTCLTNVDENGALRLRDPEGSDRDAFVSGTNLSEGITGTAGSYSKTTIHAFTVIPKDQTVQIKLQSTTNTNDQTLKVREHDYVGDNKPLEEYTGIIVVGVGSVLLCACTFGMGFIATLVATAAMVSVEYGLEELSDYLEDKWARLELEELGKQIAQIQTEVTNANGFSATRLHIQYNQ